MIEILSGTNRPGSNALLVSKMLQGMYEARGVEVRILDLQGMPPEIFSPSSYAAKPPSFEALSKRVLAADGIHVVTPEYNGSFPGVLKYFIDMLKFPESFESRCVAFTGEAAGIWGGFRSVEQLQMIFGYRNAFILPQRVWIPGIGNKWNADKTALTDETAMKHLNAQVEKFILFVEKHKHEAAKA